MTLNKKTSKNWFSLGEWIEADKPFRLADNFGTYIYHDNEVSSSIECIPHYVANRYGFDYSQVPPFQGSFFDLLRDFKYYTIRTLCDYVGFEFTYPFYPGHLKNFDEYIWHGDGKWLDKTLSELTFIYLIGDRDTGFTKIGRSVNPKTRLKQLIKQDTLMPRANDFFMIGNWVDNPATERILHYEFRQKRIRGEWFNLDRDDLLNLAFFQESRTKRVGSKYIETELDENDFEDEYEEYDYDQDYYD